MSKYIPNKAFHAALESIGFRCSFDATRKHNKAGNCLGTSVIEGTLASCLRMVDGIDEIKRAASINGDEIVSQLTSNDDGGFKGGTYGELVSALQGQLSMKAYQGAYDKYQKSGMIERIQSRIEDVAPRRKRIYSDHEGDWDYERRFEDEQFVGLTKSSGAARAIDIKCNFGIHCGVGAEQINSYGALIWAVSQLIEQAGIQTRIIYHIPCEGQNEDRDIDSSIEIELKAAEEYIAPSLLAAVFTSNFYRRVGFALDVSAAEAASQRGHYALGRPFRNPNPVMFLDGALHLGADSTGCETAVLEREILKTITQHMKEERAEAAA